MIVGNVTTSVTDTNPGTLVVSAPALGAGNTLTLAGTTAETVTGLAGNLVASGESGALNVTTKTTSLSIATGTGATTINAGALAAGKTLTLTGADAATVTGLGGNLTARLETGTLAVTTTGATQTVTTGSGNISIADDSTGVLTVNAAALAAGNTLTLTGAGAATVTGLKGNLVASGESGALNVTTSATPTLSIATGTGSTSIKAGAMTSGETLTLTGANNATVNVGGNLAAGSDTGALTVTAIGTGAHTIQTGGGADSITAAHGGDTIEGGGGGDTINVVGHTVADTFVYAATSDSLNASGANDTITGFKASGTFHDLLDFSSLNSGLADPGQVIGELGPRKLASLGSILAAMRWLRQRYRQRVEHNQFEPHGDHFGWSDDRPDIPELQGIGRALALMSNPFDLRKRIQEDFCEEFRRELSKRHERLDDDHQAAATRTSMGRRR